MYVTSATHHRMWARSCSSVASYSTAALAVMRCQAAVPAACSACESGECELGCALCTYLPNWDLDPNRHVEHFDLRAGAATKSYKATQSRAGAEAALKMCGTASSSHPLDLSDAASTAQQMRLRRRAGSRQTRRTG
eukprot:2852544-Pleurochrysis_carterae.AAC.6